MADNKQQANQPQTAKRIGGIINPIKRVLRNLGFPVHYIGARTPTYEQLNALLNFKQIANLNDREVTTEGEWEGVKIGEKKFEKEDFASYFKDKIIELYTNTGDINSSIGPFTDKNALMKEANAVARGTGGLGTASKEEIIQISRDGKDIHCTFHVPKEVPIVYNDGRKYNAAFFGVRTDNPYWVQLNKDIDEMCEKVKDELAPAGAQQSDRKRANIDFHRDCIKAWVGAFTEEISAFEEVHRRNLQGGTGVEQWWNVLDTYKSQIMKLKLKDDQMYYTHTYKVIKPLDAQGRLLDENENVLAQLPRNFKRPEELGYGLDKRGWPLEVGDGETNFDGRVIPKGAVLLDLFEGRTPPRVVPEEFIEDCDPLDTAIWIDVMYDAYRDTLRDARYHEKAITVMERIMTELNIPDLKHPQTLRDIEQGRHAEITMNLNNPPGRPNSVTMKIEPTHLNPAFDLRAYVMTPGGKTLDRKKMLYRGRKYYYELQEHSYDQQSPHPTITTRGVAMYILHRVIEETKHWSSTEDPTRPGVMELLDAIGEETHGFDVGPNMTLERDHPGWGRPFSKNPFRPRIY